MLVFYLAMDLQGFSVACFFSRFSFCPLNPLIKNKMEKAKNSPFRRSKPNGTIHCAMKTIGRVVSNYTENINQK